MLQTSYSFIRNLSLTVKVAGTASLVFVAFVFWLSYISFTHFESEFKDSIYSQQLTARQSTSKKYRRQAAHYPQCAYRQCPKA
jgi:hypothetical protein